MLVSSKAVHEDFLHARGLTASFQLPYFLIVVPEHASAGIEILEKDKGCRSLIKSEYLGSESFQKCLITIAILLLLLPLEHEMKHYLVLFGGKHLPQCRQLRSPAAQARPASPLDPSYELNSPTEFLAQLMKLCSVPAIC